MVPGAQVLRVPCATVPQRRVRTMPGGTLALRTLALRTLST
jgi:hypothetical protein